MMKKMLACLLAMMMLCTCTVNVLAEESEVEESEILQLTAEISYEPQGLLFEDLGRYVLVPLTWTTLPLPEDTENPENVQAFAGNEEGTVTFCARKMDTDMETLCAALLADGATEEMLSEVYVNGVYGLLYIPSETTVVMYTLCDEATVLVMTIQTTESSVTEVLGNVPLEIFGSMGSYVAAE